MINQSKMEDIPRGDLEEAVENAENAISQDDQLVVNQNVVSSPDLSSITMNIKNGTETEEDLQEFFNFHRAKLAWIAALWCFPCYRLRGTFSITVLALLVGLKLKERFSLVVGFWFLIISLFLLLLGEKEKFLPVVIVSAVFSLAMRCKMDDCMEITHEYKIAFLEFWLSVFQMLEQITFLLIFICALLGSIFEVGCRMRQCCQRSELPTNDWFGGDPAVLSGRENVRDVTIYDLLQDINESRHGYCFLRVLHADDRPAFLALVDEKDYVDIFQRRAIKLSIWLAIMKSMKVRANYFIYRRAYWGENKGSTVISPCLTNYVVPLWHFDRRKEIDREVSGFEYLIKMFQSLTVEEPVTRILLDNNHMETFEFSSQFRLSSWYNLHYVLPNEYFGRLVE